MKTPPIPRLSRSPDLLLILCSILPLLLIGCDKELGPDRVPTVPVHGQVLLDGRPAENVRVTFHALSQNSGDASIYTSVPSGMTDQQGEFQLSTYVQGDGVAEGTYLITFEKLRYDAFRNRYGGPDQLGGRYANPDTSGFQTTITAGRDVITLEPFELTSKEKKENQEKKE